MPNIKFSYLDSNIFLQLKCLTFASGSKPPAKNLPSFSRKYTLESGSCKTGVFGVIFSTGFVWR